MAGSVLANFRPSGQADMQAGLLQTYSHPMTKNGRSKSYILTGPEVIRPLLMSGVVQLGQDIPLNTRGCGSQYKNLNSSRGRLVLAPVKQKYVGGHGEPEGPKHRIQGRQALALVPRRYKGTQMRLERILHSTGWRDGVRLSEKSDKSVDEHAGFGARKLHPIFAIKVWILKTWEHGSFYIQVGVLRKTESRSVRTKTEHRTHPTGNERQDRRIILCRFARRPRWIH